MLSVSILEKLSISSPLLINVILFLSVGYLSENKVLCHSVKHTHPFIYLSHFFKISVSFKDDP